MAIDHFQKHFHGDNFVDWNFNIIFNSDQAHMAEFAGHYAEALDHPALYPAIPSQWLHSTILRVGLTTDYTEEEMLAVADLLTTRLASLELPEFAFSSWWLWGGNVTFHISPDEEFAKIYQYVTEALEEVVGKERATKSPHGKFMAHTSLAYTRSHHQEREIHERLMKVPSKMITFNATHVALIRQWPTDGHYEWDIVRNIPIGQL